jgi:hypothetical protein
MFSYKKKIVYLPLRVLSKCFSILLPEPVYFSMFLFLVSRNKVFCSFKREMGKLLRRKGLLQLFVFPILEYVVEVDYCR